MPFERMVEALIQRAIERGDFQNLAGRGKRIDLDLYFQAPAETRLAQKLLLDHGFVPPEVALLTEVHALETSAAAARDEETKKALLRQAAARRLELEIRSEALRRSARRS